MTAQWYIPVIIHALFIDLAFSWFLKARFVSNHIVRRFVLMYLFAAFFGAIVAAVVNQFHFSPLMPLIFLVGAANGLASYNHLRAIEYNLSALSLFAFADDVIAISLGFLLLNEAVFLNVPLIIGFVVALAAILLYSLSAYQKRKKGSPKILPASFFVSVALFTVLWGVANFAMRYFALESVDFGSFVFGWYGGSFGAALVVFSFKKEKRIREEIAGLLKENNWHLALVSSVFAVSGILLSYWAFALAPLVVAKPIFYFSATLLPAIVGLVLFKEKEDLNRKDKITFAVALVSIILIATGFQG